MEQLSLISRDQLSRFQSLNIDESEMTRKSLERPSSKRSFANESIVQTVQTIRSSHHNSIQVGPYKIHNCCGNNVTDQSEQHFNSERKSTYQNSNKKSFTHNGNRNISQGKENLTSSHQTLSTKVVKLDLDFITQQNTGENKINFPGSAQSSQQSQRNDLNAKQSQKKKASRNHPMIISVTTAGFNNLLRNSINKIMPQKCSSPQNEPNISENMEDLQNYLNSQRSSMHESIQQYVDDNFDNQAFHYLKDPNNGEFKESTNQLTRSVSKSNCKKQNTKLSSSKHTYTKSSLCLKQSQTPVQQVNFNRVSHGGQTKFEKFKKKWGESSERKNNKSISKVPTQLKIQPVTAVLNLESQNQTIIEQSEGSQGIHEQIRQMSEKILPPHYQQKLDINKGSQSTTNLQSQIYSQQFLTTNQASDKTPNTKRSQDMFAKISSIELVDNDGQNEDISNASDPEFHCLLQQQLRSIMSPQELSQLNQPSQNCYIYLNKSLVQQKELLIHFDNAKEYIKNLQKTMLFFLSFYKDIETTLHDPSKVYLQQEIMNIIKTYALGNLELDFEELQESIKEFNKQSQLGNEMIYDISQFLNYAQKNRFEIEKSSYDKIHKEIHELQKQNQKLSQSLRIKLRNENFTSSYINNYTQNKNNKYVANPFLSGSKGIHQINKTIVDLQTQIERRNNLIEQLNTKITSQEAEFDKERQETKNIQKQMKQVIQELTSKFNKLKDEKKFLRNQLLVQSNIQPGEYQDLLLERNRNLEKINQLEQVNKELVEVLNKDERFKQMKTIFVDLSNILVSRKDKIEMSIAQQEFFKCVISEGLKQECEEKLHKFKEGEEFGLEMIKIMNGWMNDLSQRDSDQGLQEQLDKIEKELIKKRNRFSLIFGHLPNISKVDHHSKSLSKHQNSQKQLEQFDNEDFDIMDENLQFLDSHRKKQKSEYNLASFSSLRTSQFGFQQLTAKIPIHQTKPSEHSSTLNSMTRVNSINDVSQKRKLDNMSPTTIPFDDFVSQNSKFGHTTTVKKKNNYKKRLQIMKKENEHLRQLIDKMVIKNLPENKPNNNNTKVIDYEAKSPYNNHFSCKTQQNVVNLSFSNIYEESQNKEEDSSTQSEHIEIEQNKLWGANQVDLLKALHTVASLLEDTVTLNKKN